jgi:hypothetical protein
VCLAQGADFASTPGRSVVLGVVRRQLAKGEAWTDASAPYLLMHGPSLPGAEGGGLRGPGTPQQSAYLTLDI